MMKFLKRLWAAITHKETAEEKYFRTIEEEAGL